MIEPQRALEILLEGNKRFVEEKSIHPNRCHETRNSLLCEQTPFAIIVSCSDSRVPTEIIFDVGLGDIFAIRTAGHVLSPEVMGSIEYAVQSLGCKLIMILGHDHCGAIKSAIKAYEEKKENISDNLKSILNHMYPVLKNLPNNVENKLDCAIKSNIKYQVNDLLNKDKFIAEKFEQKEILVVGANYNLSTGVVSIL